MAHPHPSEDSASQPAPSSEPYPPAYEGSVPVCTELQPKLSSTRVLGLARSCPGVSVAHGPQAGRAG